jgi:3-oxoacyl-[acyl-carrier protein] reductase
MPGEDVRVAIVTGVSRRAGIGFAIARRLLADGHRVLVHSWSAVDREHGLADPEGTAAVLRELGGASERLAHVEADLSQEQAAAVVVDAAVEAFGAVDILVVNHAFSPSDRLETTTAELLDRTWRTNARAAVLLAQAFAPAPGPRRRRRGGGGVWGGPPGGAGPPRAGGAAPHGVWAAPGS